MSNTLNTTIKAAILAHLIGGPNLGGESFDVGARATDVITLTSGTGANQADLVFADSRTLAASANETLDLYGSLKDPFGSTLNFARIKAILIEARAANTNNVVIGNAVANPFLGPLGGTTPTVTLPPGGVLLLVAPASGWTVADATNDSLKIANSGGTTGVTYDIVVIGASA